jgi:branched-chain amino acid transport system permease protein
MVIISPIAYLTGYAILIQQILIFSILALSYDFFSGYTGYYNLGYGAIAAVGAYVFTLSNNAGLNVFLALILAGAAGAIFALGMSYPFLRLRGAYFAIATLALVLLLDIVDVNLPQYTGGEIGLHVLLSEQTSTPNYLFVGSLLLLLACLSVHYAIGRSRLGLALRSIREEEDVSESYGVNAFRIKQIVLVISGFFGGLGGSVLAIYFGFINPDNVLGLSIALFPVVAAMSGGPGIFLGPLVGGFLLVGINLTLPNFIDTINPTFNIIGPLVVTGFLLLLVGLFVPTGLIRVKFVQKYMYRNPDRLLSFRKRRPTPSKSATAEAKPQT